jgi:hypothetical protein
MTLNERGLVVPQRYDKVQDLKDYFVEVARDDLTWFEIKALYQIVKHVPGMAGEDPSGDTEATRARMMIAWLSAAECHFETCQMVNCGHLESSWSPRLGLVDMMGPQTLDGKILEQVKNLPLEFTIEEWAALLRDQYRYRYIGKEELRGITKRFNGALVAAACLMKRQSDDEIGARTRTISGSYWEEILETAHELEDKGLTLGQVQVAFELSDSIKTVEELTQTVLDVYDKL